MGKSAGFGPEFVAVKDKPLSRVFNDLDSIFRLRIVLLRCGLSNRLLEPIRELPGFRIFAQFVPCHLLEECIEVYALAAFHESAFGIDSRVGSDRGDHCARVHFDTPGLLNDAFQGRSHIAPALGEQTECMRMPVHGRAVREFVLRGDGGRAAPTYKVRLYAFAFDVLADSQVFSWRARLTGFDGVLLLCFMGDGLLPLNWQGLDHSVRGRQDYRPGAMLDLD